MTYYTKFQGTITHGESADYNRARSWGSTYEFSPTTYLERLIVKPGTSGLTIDTSPFSGITGMLIQNRSTITNEIVRVKWYDQLTTYTSGATGWTFTSGTPDTIVDADAANRFTAGTGATEAGTYAYVNGSASDDGVYLITAVAANALSVNQNTTFSGATETVTIYTVSMNSVWIPADGGSIFETGSIVPGLDVYLDAASGTPEVAISLFGT